MSKVFISCGQSSASEISVAKEISDWFLSNGYKPYVAIETQNLSDVNSGIINELKTSDYFLFIDFKREEINKSIFRGSLFTNQELAIAYILGFEKSIFLKHQDIKLEGITQYMTTNAVTFKDETEVLLKIKNLVVKHNWTTDYSRNLIIDELILSDICDYCDNVYKKRGKILTAMIKNNRADKAAYNTVARLENIKYNGVTLPSPDINLLKASGQLGYNQIIWQKSCGQIDLLLISADNPEEIYLNSFCDVKPRLPIINKSGQYTLYYSIISEFFPRLDFSLEINVDYKIENFKYEIKS